MNQSQDKNTEILTSKEEISLNWNYIRESDPSSIPPFDKMLFFKIKDQYGQYKVTAGYRVADSDYPIATELIFRIYIINRNPKNGYIKEIYSEYEIIGKNDKDYEVVAWADMPAENWFSIEI